MEKKKCSGIKIAVRVTVFILLLGIFSVTGYEMYSTALEKKIVSEMAADIKSRCRFAEYSELPKFYENAVIAAEGRNFFGHNTKHPLITEISRRKNP